MNKIFDRDDAKLAKLALDDGIVREGDALLVDLGIAALVDQLAHGLEVRLAKGDVGLDETEHLASRLGHLDEHTVVDLDKAEQLQNFAGLGGHFVDTGGIVRDGMNAFERDLPLDADDEKDLGLAGDVEVTGGAGGAAQPDLLLLLGEVLLHIGVCTLEDHLALGSASLQIQCVSVVSQRWRMRRAIDHGVCKGSVPKDGMFEGSMVV